MSDAPRRDGGLAAWLRAKLGIDAVRAQLERQHEDMQRVLKTMRTLDERLRALEHDTAAGRESDQAQLKDIRLQMRDVHALLQGMRDQLGSRGLTQQIKLLRLDTRALLRRALVDPSTLPYPHRLIAERASLGSQREEDGITWAIFQRAGAGNRRFIDIGSGIDGGIAGFYARECGWRGLMVDANADHVDGVRARFSREQVVAVASYVTRENVNQLIADAGFSGDVDLLSIDIDGMDYWVWDALSITAPRLVVVEYNALFGHERAVTVPYEATFDRSRFPGVLKKRYYGASLPAMVGLAGRKGYRLVAIEPNALNAFFLRTDVAAEIPACAIGALPYSDVDTSRFEDIYRLIAEAGLPLVDVAS